MGWLNASDVLNTRGLFVVGSVFASLPSVDWLKGKPTRLNPNGMTVDIRATELVSLALPGGRQQIYLTGIDVLEEEPVGKSRLQIE